MAIQLQGSTGVVAEVAGTGFRAVKTQVSPIEYGSLGAYALSQVSQTIGAGIVANAEIWQFLLDRCHAPMRSPPDYF